MTRTRLAALVGTAVISMAMAPAPLETAFHNTIVSTYPDGRTAELWLDRDGSYVAEGRRHDRSSGHWKLKGGKLCLKQSHPIPVPFTYCTAVHDGGVGTSWAGKAVSGEAINIKVVKGRAGGGSRRG